MTLKTKRPGRENRYRTVELPDGTRRVEGTACAKQLPFEDLQPEIAQNFKFVLDWVGEIACRAGDLEAKDCCPDEPFVIGGVTPPTGPVSLDINPYENIYANGFTWLGHATSDSDKPLYQVFDAAGKRVANITRKGVMGAFANKGTNACWHPRRGEVWITDRESGTGHLAVQVYDDESFAFLREKTYPALPTSSTPPVIEWEPSTDQIVVGYASRLHRIDAANMNVVTSSAGPLTHSAGTQEPLTSIAYQIGTNRWWAADKRDHVWELDGDTFAQLLEDPNSLGWGGADVLDEYTELTYGRETGHMFLTDWPSDGLMRLAAADTMEIWSTARADFDPQRYAPSEYIPRGSGYVGMGWFTNHYALQTDYGQAWVTLHKLGGPDDSKVVKEWFFETFTPGRISYNPLSDALVVANYPGHSHPDTGENHAWWLRISAPGESIPVRDPAGSPSGPTPPSGGEEELPIEPTPTSEGPADDPNDPPKLLNVETFCEDWTKDNGDGTFTGGVRRGFWVEFEPTYTTDPIAPSEDQHDILVFFAGTEDAARTPFHILSPAPPPTKYKVALWTVTVENDTWRPTCAGDGVEVSYDVAVRRNQPNDAFSPGPLSNKITRSLPGPPSAP